MTLRVLEPGLYTLVVDRGRPGYRRLGVPLGGAADRFALAVGNALVGNPPDTAALEISLAGPTLQAGCVLAGVVYGAPFELTSDRQALTAGTTFTLQPGEELRIGGTARGMRAYLCVRGGIPVQPVLGSYCALQPVEAEADLPCMPASIGARFVLIPPDRGPCGLDAGLGNQPITVRAVAGPQASWFAEEEVYSPAEGSSPAGFVVTPASNRMGLRLEGKPLRLPERELVSEPVCPGAVQVTRDGQCIVLGVDGQTIGGYPKIAQVIQADLDRLGQLRPGDRIRFIRVSLEEAEAIYHQKQAVLNNWVTRLRASLD